MPMPTIVGSVIGCIIGLAIIGFVRAVEAKHDLNAQRTAAIKAGVAEYRITDPATGATEFRFVPCECKEAAQ